MPHGTAPRSSQRSTATPRSLTVSNGVAYKGMRRLNPAMTTPWSLPASDGVVHGGVRRLTPATLQHSIRALALFGFVVLRAPAWWRANALDEGSAAASGELEQLKLEYSEFALAAASKYGRRLPPPPWEHSHSTYEAAHRFQFQEGFSYTHGRLNMPLLAEMPPFDELPYRANPDLLTMCSGVYGGFRCKQTTAGALWNFPGANSTYWHRDYPDDWQLLTVITAMRDYPLDAGWLALQQETHKGGAFHGVRSSAPPRDEEPKPVTTILHKGDTLVFTATTKHAVTPNPSAVERGLFYSVYAVAGRKDTYNMPDGLPSLRTLLARVRANVSLTPSLHARMLEAKAKTKAEAESKVAAEGQGGGREQGGGQSQGGGRVPGGC